MPFNSREKALIKNSHRLKIQFSDNTGKISKNKVQQENSWNVINKDFKNTRHPLKA